MPDAPLILPTPQRPLVLASSSRYRRALIEGLGLVVENVAPDFDESAVPRDGRTPDELALYLARGKAESVRGRRPEHWILAGDQLLDLDGEILGKPGTPERAVEQLCRLSGRSHRLVTALVLLDEGGGLHETLTVHTMRMRRLDRAALADYVARDNPVDCAGSYKIEALGSALFESMEGTDHTAIVGLPVTALVRLLRAASSSES